jgi:acetolactate synthase regulatory subunit
MCHCPQESRLEIVADSDPTLLARICGIFGGLGFIPARVESVADVAAGTCNIAVDVPGLPPRHLDLIQRKLSQLTSVQSVRRKSA